MLKTMTSAIGLCLAASCSTAGERPATAAELGLMQGEPPPADKRVDQGNFMRAPYNRWALQHMRELVPTRMVPRGESAVAPLVDV